MAGRGSTTSSRDRGQDGLARLWLETGSFACFDAARALYAKAGFVACEPFGDYRPDPNSTFMSLPLR